MIRRQLLLLVLSLVQHISANTEKVIFIAPEPLAVPQDASIDNLQLIPLTPDHLTYRTYINASFPTEQSPHGDDTWILIEGLTPGQRYELRVCWLATQPTAFWIYTHTLSSVFESSPLVTSLSSYSFARHAQLDHTSSEDLRQRRYQPSQDRDTSLLFLQIQAAADYFSLDTALMENVPPVHVDLILDPYLLNIFPQSLGPTAVYIAVVAVLAWYLSGWIYGQVIEYVATNWKESSGHAKKIK